MANTAALIRESIWRNKEFRALTRGAQCTYLQLCSQKDLDCAGLLTLNIGVLAKGCAGIDQDTIRDDLKELEAERFVFIDEDTDELFIRSYMRTAEVIKSPNIFKSALKSAGLVESEKLRVEVAGELRRLRRAEADRLADQLNPSETPRGDATKPSETLPKNGTLPEPSSTSTGTSTGTSSPSVGGNSGEHPPRPECPDHAENYDGPCRRCERRRKWDEANAERVEANDRAAKAAAAQAARDCPDCEGTNWITDADGEPIKKCDHRGARDA
ncbi:hypothetical protein A5637_13265 [Mycolicibacterium fortuitum]|uniref:hypothetical protein n=1 Tax=Mycolicibacterium fortuitum TaxID=1766 RepID=UPI0007EDC127|nr:hypothetical protein [Mycolicibacterium fortuitum]OBK04045.1 hypothetical protein A5637_13265 [Mycolicibacterium fortuitum]